MKRVLSTLVWIAAVWAVFASARAYDICHKAHWTPPPPHRVPTAVWRVEARYVNGERIIGMKWEWRNEYPRM